jgi:hypothetical protein
MTGRRVLAFCWRNVMRLGKFAPSGSVLHMDAMSLAYLGTEKMNSLKWLAVSTLVHALVPALGGAQSCPAADSALGPRTKGMFHLGYDRMRDSSVATGGMHIHTPMAGQPATFIFTVGFSGQRLPASAIIQLSASTTQLGEGGAVMGRSNGHQLSTAMAQYADVADLFMMLDDSVRVRLTKADYKVQLKKAGALMPEKLEETMWFTVPLSSAAQIGNSRKVEIQWGNIRATAGRKTAEGVKELARYLMCNAPAPADSIPR